MRGNGGRPRGMSGRGGGAGGSHRPAPYRFSRHVHSR